MASKKNKSLAISQANNHLAVNLYQLLAKEGENVFFSPFSLSTALAILYCGCESKTAEEMRNTLGYAAANLKDEDIKVQFQRLLNEIESHSDGYTLACANTVLSDKKFGVKEGFKSLVEESFKARMQLVDFANDSQGAVQEINTWVAQKTNNMIKKLIQSLTSNTVMVILNAVYFKGFWLNQFQKSSTHPEKFYNKGSKDNAKKVEMMYQKKEFLYLADTSFKALQLPYKGDDIAMLILLPNSINGLEKLESSLSASMICNLKHKMHKVKVQVSLPKFRLEYSKQLKEQFQCMNMKRAFVPGADFGGFNDSKALYVSKIIHKAVLEVNEEGAEAAAATAVVVALRCLKSRPDPEFIVDHPFLFVIYNVKNDIILFMGKVMEL